MKKIFFKSFHVGSGVRDPESYAAAIRTARQVFNQAGKLGFQMDLLDIGGGFPGDMYAAIVPQFEKVTFCLVLLSICLYPLIVYRNQPSSKAEIVGSITVRYLW